VSLEKFRNFRKKKIKIFFFPPIAKISPPLKENGRSRGGGTLEKMSEFENFRKFEKFFLLRSLKFRLLSRKPPKIEGVALSKKSSNSKIFENPKKFFTPIAKISSPLKEIG